MLARIYPKSVISSLGGEGNDYPGRKAARIGPVGFFPPVVWPGGVRFSRNSERMGLEVPCHA